MRQVRTCCEIFLMLFLIVACGKGISPDEEAFATLVPGSMNTGLRLKLVEVNETLSGAPTITLFLENHSSDQVWFLAPQYGARIFVYSQSNGKWVEVDDLSTPVSEVEDILVPKGQGINWGAEVFVVPSIPDARAPVTVRIVVTGEVYRDGQRTGEEVGAYIDVTLP